MLFNWLLDSWIDLKWYEDRLPHRCERVKDIFISILIPPINGERVDDFDPRLLVANDFLHFSRKAVLSLWSQERQLLYSSSIINASKRKILSSSLYSEVKMAKLFPLQMQWISDGSHQYPKGWAPSFFGQVVKVNGRYQSLTTVFF